MMAFGVFLVHKGYCSYRIRTGIFSRCQKTLEPQGFLWFHNSPPASFLIRLSSPTPYTKKEAVHLDGLDVVFRMKKVKELIIFCSLR